MKRSPLPHATDDTIKQSYKKGDRVVCVDDSGVDEVVKTVNPRKKKGQKNPPKPRTVTVPAILTKGKKYTVVGVTRPPHDTPERPLLLLCLPKPNLYLWWDQRRFKKA